MEAVVEVEVEVEMEAPTRLQEGHIVIRGKAMSFSVLLHDDDKEENAPPFWWLYLLTFIALSPITSFCNRLFSSVSDSKQRFKASKSISVCFTLVLVVIHPIHIYIINYIWSELIRNPIHPITSKKNRSLQVQLLLSSMRGIDHYCTQMIFNTDNKSDDYTQLINGVVNIRMMDPINSMRCCKNNLF